MLDNNLCIPTNSDEVKNKSNQNHYINVFVLFYRKL